MSRCLKLPPTLRRLVMVLPDLSGVQILILFVTSGPKK